MANPFAAPKTGIPFTSGTGTLSDYEKRIAADPNYTASKTGDKVGWIVQNYGKEWLKSDGTAPDEAIWTYTGGENGQPKIGSVTGINYLPWNDKNNQYDVNGQDYSRPQYANGPGLPTGGYKGTPAEIQAARDATNWYRNGGQGMNPAMLASLQNVNQMGGLRGNQRKSYTLPDGSVYNKSHAVRDPATGRYTWVNSSFSGPGGSWNENHFNTTPGAAFGLGSGNASNGLRPGQFIPNGTQGSGPPQQGGGGPVPIPPGAGSGPVPAYAQMPAGQQGRFAAGQQARAPRGPWMQQMDSTDAMAAQIAQAAALRGTNG